MPDPEWQMELTEISVRPEAARPLRTADVGGRRQVHITLVYDEDDIDDMAAAAGVDVGAGERDSMLTMVDDAITGLVHEALRAALGDRLRQQMGVVAAGHACSEDE